MMPDVRPKRVSLTVASASSYESTLITQAIGANSSSRLICQSLPVPAKIAGDMK